MDCGESGERRNTARSSPAARPAAQPWPPGRRCRGGGESTRSRRAPRGRCRGSRARSRSPSTVTSTESTAISIAAATIWQVSCAQAASAPRRRSPEHAAVPAPPTPGWACAVVDRAAEVDRAGNGRVGLDAARDEGDPRRRGILAVALLQRLLHCSKIHALPPPVFGVDRPRRIVHVPPRSCPQTRSVAMRIASRRANGDPSGREGGSLNEDGLRAPARGDAAEHRHLRAGARGARALQTARHDDAGEHRQLRAGQQPPRLPPVLGLLHRPRRPARAPRLRRALRRRPRGRAAPPRARSRGSAVPATALPGATSVRVPRDRLRDREARHDEHQREQNDHEERRREHSPRMVVEVRVRSVRMR